MRKVGVALSIIQTRDYTTCVGIWTWKGNGNGPKNGLTKMVLIYSIQKKHCQLHKHNHYYYQSTFPILFFYKAHL